jgi:hypothetical protein
MALTRGGSGSRQVGRNRQLRPPAFHPALGIGRGCRSCSGTDACGSDGRVRVGNKPRDQTGGSACSSRLGPCAFERDPVIGPDGSRCTGTDTG